MKVNISKEIQKHTRTGSIVMHAITYDIKDKIGNLREFADKYKNEQGDIEVDLKLILDGHEVDLKSYFKRWEKGVQEGIEEKVKNTISDEFIDLQDLINDLSDRINIEITKRFTSWEQIELKNKGK